MRLTNQFILGLAIALSAIPAHATETLKQLQFPAADKAPWRFQEFPILAWWPPPGDQPLQAFQDYRDAGFNLYPLNPDVHFEAGLEKATSAGLSIMPFIARQGFGHRAPDDPVTYPYDHPGVVGWITYDEPGDFNQVRRSIKSVNELMLRDPTRWALFNCLPPHASPIDTAEVIEAAIRNGMPVISYDNYVIHEDGTTNEAQHYAAAELYRQLSLEHDVPFWAFALTIKHFHYRRASESDLRWKQYTNLAYGAKGLWYFTYWGPTDWENWDNKAIVDPANGAKTELYHYVKAINENVQSMGPHLLALTNTHVMHTTATPENQQTFQPNKHWITNIQATNAIISLFQHNDGSRYAIIVNKQHAKNKSATDLTDKITLTFAPEIQSIQIIAHQDGTTGPLPLTNNQTTLDIAGGTGVLISTKD